MGIPNIYASNQHDLFFAQGYVHAQDRFWQMDVWRHIGSGTISEMFGGGRVDTDTFLRTLGWKQVAEEEYAGLDPDTKAILDSYTEGVNAYLKDHDKTSLSLEYAILGLLSPDYKVQLWTPVNSLTWGKAMAWDLRGNMDEEIQRAKDRPLTSIYWNVVVIPHLEWYTKEYSLDPAQQNQVRTLLALRRNKFVALLDSTPHPSIRLSRLAPLIERVGAPAKPATSEGSVRK